MADKNTYYIATSIPYVNAPPHIGFAWELIIGDVLARYYKQEGRDVFFSTGTDEHGGKIQETAEKQGISPERLAQQNTQAFKDLAPILNVEYTKFITTTSKEHEQRAHKIWQNLEKYIYKGAYVGMYDVREETFITIEESKVMMEKDPERYDTLQKLEEQNYFFKLSAFTKPIKEAVESNKLRIIPKTRRNEILNLLNDGLDDISISRPSDKIPWGIGVPGDKTQTIYVWFEALMNYITTLGYPDGKDFKKFWPGQTQVIGKDIIRFHAAIWPAMLMGLGEEIPEDIYVHGFITVDNSKMSKSVGNVVSPLELVSNYGTDAARYFLLRHIPSYNDGDFSWQKMEQAYNSELGNELGNLVQRVYAMVEKYSGGEIKDPVESAHDDGNYSDALKDYRFDKALDHIWLRIRGLNQYIDEQKPWALAKNPEELKHLDEVLAYLVMGLRDVSRLLQPFMPETAAAIEKIYAENKLKKPEGPLFPRIEKFTKMDRENSGKEPTRDNGK